MLIKQCAGERPLGAFPPQHVELLGREKLAPLVLAVGHLINMAFGVGDVRPRQAQYGERGSGGAGVKQMSAREHSALSPVSVPGYRLPRSRPLNMWGGRSRHCSVIH